MARKPRLHYEGVLYHVMVRGNGGQDIFADDEDRYRFYLFLQEGVEKYRHRIHAFKEWRVTVGSTLAVSTVFQLRTRLGSPD